MSPSVILAIIAAYLVGGIPFGLLFHHLAGKGDIRHQGSGNIGATNVFRSGGKALGLLTLLCDIGKGALGVALATALTAGERWWAAAAVATVVGHCYPVYLRFRGGKGVATGCGAFGFLAPIPMGIALLIFLTTMLVTRMVSVGSLTAAIALPLLLWWSEPDVTLIVAVIASVLVVIVRHRQNITRIVTGGEHRVDDR